MLYIGNMERSGLRKDGVKIKRIAKTMKHLGHPSRILIVRLLLERGPLLVKEIHETLGLSQSNTSQHLRNLEVVGILSSQREGNRIRYWINKPEVKNLIECAYKTTFEEKD